VIADSSSPHSDAVVRLAGDARIGTAVGYFDIAVEVDREAAVGITIVDQRLRTASMRHLRKSVRMTFGGSKMPKLTYAAGMLAGLIALWAGPAAAYIGPGAGITMLGALWGVIVAVALALGAVLFWPIRILLRKRRKASTPTGAVARDKAS
jgi:hypothetical protein